MTWRVSAREIGKRRRLTPSTSTRLEEPPEIRNSGCTAAGSSSTQRSSRAPAASERSSGTGCALCSSSTPAWRCSSAAGVGVTRDDESLLDRLPERVEGTERHGDGGLADRGDPYRRGAGGVHQRLAHAAAPVDAPQARSAAGRAAGRGGGRRRPRASAPAHDLELAAPLAAGELGGVRALELQALEVLGRDVAGRRTRPRSTRCRTPRCAHPRACRRRSDRRDPGRSASRRRSGRATSSTVRPLATSSLDGRHVDAVDVGEAHRRRGRGEVHLRRRPLRAPAR